MLRNFLIIGFLLGFIFLLIPNAAEAAPLVSCGLSQDDPATSENEALPCQLCHFFQLIKNILDIFLFPFVPVIGALFFAIGGFYLFAGGANPQWVSRGKTILIATVVGLVIVYTSWVFLSLFLDLIGVASWTGLGNWWVINCSIAAAPPPSPFGRVFVTSSENFDGNLGGLGGANVECTSAATAAGLGGTWIAWLSTDTLDAKDLVTNQEYRLVNGVTIVATDTADLTDGSLGAPINIDENGNPVSLSGVVITGTLFSGQSFSPGGGFNCSGWTTNVIGPTALAGDHQDSGILWSNFADLPCRDSQYRLYCFEQ